MYSDIKKRHIPTRFTVKATSFTATNSYRYDTFMYTTI